TKTRAQLDLLDQAAVYEFLDKQQFDEIYLAAAKVGGIHANSTYPAEFIHQNITIQSNIIHGAHRSGVNRLLFLGSSCIYPRMAIQPMNESELLQGSLEQTNEPYAIAKIAGIKMCEAYNRQYGRDYRSVMPTNLYGPGDNYHPENSHVIPGMINRFYQACKTNAESIVIWGSGNPMREFLHVDDMAAASVHVMNIDSAAFSSKVSPTLSHINIGTGKDCSIRELAESLCCVSGFKGQLEFDTSKPDGTPRKLLDVALIESLGWSAKIDLRSGLESTWATYIEQLEQAARQDKD
ncbi:UNVERIFIED_CONTAM: hypothetical protein GTU68_006394, partial [Idotea baltica]|nr:hypothetical protein [Idotea baltica]